VPAVTNVHLDLQGAYNLRSVSFVVRADENLGRLLDVKSYLRIVSRLFG
jgi:hypothetical protein